MEQLAVILPAAGRSARFGGPRSKLAEMLAGKTVIRRAVEAFLRRRDVCDVIIATSPDLAAGEPMPVEAFDPRIRFTRGGPSRAKSVWLALEQLSDNVEWVAIHDAARPLVSDELIDRTFAAAKEHGAAVPALPVPLTVKQAEGPLPARVQRTLPRHALWAMQTPQIMRRAALLSAYSRCTLPLEQITDDAQLLELAGEEVWLVNGEERNLKITTPGDLKLAEHFLGVS